MKVDVLLGLQWGDEGKGKVVDVLTPRYDAVARFQGGPNAGHTLEFEDKKYVLRSIPSGIFQHGQINIIGNGVVLDPVLFKQEAEELEKSGVDLRSILKISKKVHLITPTHRLLDAANEKAKGGKKIGTTGKGVTVCASAMCSITSRKNTRRSVSVISVSLRLWGLLPRILTSLKKSGWMRLNISRVLESLILNFSSTAFLPRGKVCSVKVRRGLCSTSISAHILS